MWNEVWMARSDLDEGDKYNGWQVIDPTPHTVYLKEISCGPTSVNAVRLLELQKPYDTDFVVSEILSEVLIWRLPGKTRPTRLLFRKSDQ